MQAKPLLPPKKQSWNHSSRKRFRPHDDAPRWLWPNLKNESPLSAGLGADHRCEYCRAPEVMFIFPFEVEHIFPLSAGGADHETNLALACRSCNLRKGNHLSGLDETTRRRSSHFRPAYRQMGRTLSTGSR